MRTFSLRALAVASVGLFVASTGLAVGCGGSDTPANTAPTSTATPALDAKGEVPPGTVGMTDAPSSGEQPDTAAPQMNAAAVGFYRQGLTAYASGDLAGAKNFFNQAINADSKAHQAYYSLGTAQERLRDSSGAAASYKQALAIVPEYEPAIIAYSTVLARKGQVAEADKFLTERKGAMPKSAAVLAALAEVKSIQKDHGAAQRLAQDALKLNPDYRKAMVVLARDHYRARRLDNAMHALTAILDGFEPVKENPPRDAGNPEALLIRGLIHRERGKRPQAIEDFRKAVAARPDFVEASVALATYLLEAGSAEEAQPLLERAIKFDSENVAAHLNLGDTYRLLGKSAEAKKEFDWVVAKEPNMPQVHYDLGLLYLYATNIPGFTAKQQIAEAQKSLKKYQDLRPKGTTDDSSELINIAKVKEGELQAATAAAAPAAATPAATGTAAAPAATGTAATKTTAAPAPPPAPPKK